MSEFKGTKGVWKLIDVTWLNNSNVFTHTVSVDGSEISVCNSFGETKEEAEANAKLIAASPELLDFLISSVDEIREVGLINMSDYIETLIKKATE